jgi:hypothetical protein
MEPLSALGLAGAIVQFVDFCSKLLDGAVTAYSQGSAFSPEISDLSDVTRDLANVTSQLAAPPPNRQDEALCKLAANCQAVSNELQDILKDFMARTAKSKRESLRVAWVHLMKRKEIASLQARLDRYRSEIVLQLAVIMR